MASDGMVEVSLDDYAVLAAVGQMYLDAVDADPELEFLTLPQAMIITQVRDAVDRAEAATAC